MIFSYNFVKKFLDIDLPVDELSDKMTLAGFEVCGVEDIASDKSIEVELTSDRPDMLSIVGVAHELAALSNKQAKIDLLGEELVENKESSMTVEIEDKSDCPWYSATVIRGVEIKESPQWLKDILEASGVAVVNNIVDITNYCMLKWGEPMHAFDAATLDGGIVVRKAKHEEELTCIDGKERILTKDLLVIADQSKAIAMAGVMGGESTMINENTKDIVLECALFDPVEIRRSRKALGMNTDSSYRFERFVYPSYAVQALREARKMILELAGGEIVQALEQGQLKNLESSDISLDVDVMNTYLGTDIPKDSVKEILTDLGCQVNEVESELIVSTPAFRQDLKIKQDIYEEVVRIWGFDKVPNLLPMIPRRVHAESLYDFKVKQSEKLRKLSFCEAITMNIVSSKHKLLDENKKPVMISNPLKAIEDQMRRDLYPGLIDSLIYNSKQKQPDCDLFECAHVFETRDGQSYERDNIAMVSHARDELAFFDFKAKVESFINSTVEAFEVEDKEHQFFSAYRVLKVEEKEIGFIAVLKSDIAKDLDLEKVFIAEFDLELLFALRKAPKFKKINYYPTMSRDISLAAEKSVVFADIEKEILQTTGELYKDIEIVDVYRGKKVAKGTTAFTLRVIYQHQDRTLESEEVDSIHFKLRDKLAQLSGLSLR